MKTQPMLIDGAWVPAATGDTMPVTDPRTGEAFAVVARAGEADALAAIDAADRAFVPWAKQNVF